MQTANQTLVFTKRRSLLRFSLRTQLVSVAIVGVVFGAATFWHRTHQIEHDRQLRIVQELKLAGAQVRWRSSAPDWIIESDYFAESPSINQSPVFRALEFVEEVICLPDADLDRVFDLLRELPRASEISINVADFKPGVSVKLSERPTLKKVYVDYYRHLDWLNDQRYETIIPELRNELPGIEIVGCARFDLEVQRLINQ